MKSDWKKGIITITKGEKGHPKTFSRSEVRAQIFRDAWAVNKTQYTPVLVADYSGPFYTLTHVKSGFCIGRSYPSAKIAKFCAEKIYKILGKKGSAKIRPNKTGTKTLGITKENIRKIRELIKQEWR